MEVASLDREGMWDREVCTDEQAVAVENRALFHGRSSGRPCGTHLGVIPLMGEEAAGGFIHQLLALIHRDHSEDLNSLAVPAFSGDGPYFPG